MANISFRLSRSIYAFRRVRCTLPITLRHFHDGNNGTGADDKIKKQHQDNKKIPSPSNPWETNRSGKATSSSSLEKDCQIKADKSIDLHVSATKAGGSYNSDIENKSKNNEQVLAPSNAAQKVDFAGIEKVCEENIKYITTLLSDEKLDSKVVSKKPEVTNKAESSSNNRSLRIPSHTDVHRESLKQQSLIHDFDSNIESSTKAQSLRIPAHVDEHEKDVNITSKTEATDKEKSLEPSVSIAHVKGKSNDQRKPFKFTDMVTKGSVETPYTSFVKNSHISDSKGLKDFYYEKVDLSSKKSANQHEKEPSSMTLGITDEPYIFPTEIKNNSFDNDRKIKASNRKSDDIEDVDIEMLDSHSNEKSKINKSDHSDIENDNLDEIDSRSSYTPEALDDIESDSRLSSQFYKKDETDTAPNYQQPTSINDKRPLRGTVAILFEAQSKIRAQQELNMSAKNPIYNEDNLRREFEDIYPDLISHQSTQFEAKIVDDSGIGRNNIISKMSTDNSESDSKTGTVVINFDENPSKIIAKLSSEDCNKNESSKYNPVDSVFEVKKNSRNYKWTTKINKIAPNSTKSNERYNPVDSIFELKSMAPKAYSNTAAPSGTSDKEKSVMKTTIKSESNLTPGELYHSNSECATYENVLDNSNTTFKRVEYRADKFDKIKSKVENNNRKHRQHNLNSYKNFDAKKSDNDSSRFEMMDETKTGETLEETYAKYEKEINSENPMTPGDLYNTRSEGDQYEDWATSCPNKKQIRNEMDFKPTYREKSIDYQKSDEFNDKNDGLSLDEEKLQNDFKMISKRRQEVGDDFTEMREGDMQNVEETTAFRDKHDDEEFEYAKRYINKAKRLHDAAKKRSMDRKKRMRNSPRPGHKKKSKAKLTLSEFLTKIVGSKDDGNTGDSNRRNFSTSSDGNSLKYWVLQRRNSHESTSAPAPDSKAFISPDVVKQGLGAASICEERHKNEEKRKLYDSTIETSQLFSFDGEHITIQGGSVHEQKHRKRIEKINRDDEKFDVKIRGGPLDTKKGQKPKEVPKRNTRKINKLGKNIWECFWEPLK